MKLTKFFMPLALLGLMASCASDNIEGPTPEPTPNPSVNTGSDVYLNMTLSMAGTTGTRAAEFKDGEKAEFAVNDATLYIFDDNAGVPNKCIEVVKLDAYFDGISDGETNEITDRSTVIQKVKLNNVKKESSTKYWGLVILNKGTDNQNGFFKSGGTNTLVEPSAGSNTPWTSFTSQVTSEYKSGDYFVMTNAPGWVGTKGNGGVFTAATINKAPQTLAEITESNLYYEGETSADPVSVYVQRVAAKIEVTSNLLANAFAEGGQALNIPSDGDKDKIKFDEWWLDVTNTKTYPVQLLDDGQNKIENGFTSFSWASTTFASVPMQRFIGGTEFTRFYWAVDPNYSTRSAEQNDFTTSSTTPETGTHSAYESDYCLENTFSVSAMMQNQSTRVVFKGKYMVGGVEGSFLSYNGNYTKTFGSLTLKPTTSGTAKLTELFNEDVTEGTYATDFAAVCKALNVATNSDADINVHIGGEVYYAVIIRHFENSELIDGHDKDDLYWAPTGNSYGEDAIPENYLGRYGVLRNNWYVVNVNSVLGPGEPTVPEPGDTPDDDPKQLLLDCQINILSWAQRQHDYDLK